MSIRALIFTIAIAGTAIATTINAQPQVVNGDGVVTVLVPINAPTPTSGSRGAIWMSELWVHNGEAFPLRIRDCGDIMDGTPCLPLHPSGKTELAFGGETTSSLSGALIFSFPVRSKITLSSRLFELSRGAQPAGVYLPVVHANQFFTDSARFIALSGGARRRVTLRLFDPRRRQDFSLRVTVVDESGVELGSTIVPLRTTNSPVEPGYAAIYDLTSVFPQLTTVDRYDAIVSPPSPGTEFWALASVTDNETQQVLLVQAEPYQVVAP